MKDVTQMYFRSSKKIMGFLLLAHGRNQSESHFFQQIIRLVFNVENVYKHTIASK